jgi:hypothetical protein
MSYPSENADSLELYVLWHFNLSSPAYHLYRGLRWLERKQASLCKPIIAPYRDLATYAMINVKTTRKALLELQERGLIELSIGSSDKTDRKATTIRRKTLDEIKMKSMQGDDDAHRLATSLSCKSFVFDGKLVKPMWTVSQTGRVVSSKPNIQGVTGGDPVRVAGLRPGLKLGEVLVHADIKAAEPNVIKGMIGYDPSLDLYQAYALAEGCSRDKAKKPVNTLATCRNTMAYYRHYPAAATPAFEDYVQKLADYKAQLFADFKKTRSVTTLTGRRIIQEGKRKSHIHAGTVMSWRVQGTIADIINAASLRLVPSASVVLPVADAIYAILPSERADEVETCIIAKAREIGLTVTLATTVHHAA